VFLKRELKFCCIVGSKIIEVGLWCARDFVEEQTEKSTHNAFEKTMTEEDILSTEIFF